MIIDSVDNADLYLGIHSRLTKAFEYLRSADLSVLKPGRFTIEGDDLYGIMQSYVTGPKLNAVWEAHRKYADLHLVLQGEESIGYAPFNTLRVTKKYDEKNDCVLLEGEGSYFYARPGMFVFLGPWDGHQPGLMITDPKPVIKVVLKVKL